MNFTFLLDKIVQYSEIILVVLIAFVIINRIKAVLKKLLSLTSFPLDLQNIFQKTTVYILWFGVLIYIMTVLNLEDILKPIIGGSVLVGAALALAVKDILSDAVAGLFLLSDKHFNIGDQIETMSHKGEIINVSLRKTRIRTSDGTIVVLPNGKIDSAGWIFNERIDKINDTLI